MVGPDDVMLPRLLAARAQATPDEEFIQDVAGPSVSCRQFYSDVLRWAAAFRRIGVEPGERVVTMFPHDIDAYRCWLGLAWARAVEVPVNTAYKGQMLEYVISNSGARRIVTSSRFTHLLEGVDLAPQLQVIVIGHGESEVASSALATDVLTGSEFLADAEPDALDGPAYWDVCTMIYTSGTTGPSKGVVVPWGELAAFSLNFPADFLERGGAYYSPFPIFHLGGKHAVGLAAMRGARLVIRESFSPSCFWSDIRTFGCTATSMFGPTALMLLAAPRQSTDRDHPLRTINLAPLSPEIEPMKERFGVRVMTGYGMTEIGFVMTSGWDLPNYRTCGKVRDGWPHYELRVVDEHDETVPPKTVGELVVRSRVPWVMNLGYHGDDEKTAAAWRNGWFHTGDGFMMDDDGWFYFVDRMKDAIRRRGENISSFEVEALVNSHPLVEESAAIGVPSELGEEDVKVFIVLSDRAILEASDLLESLDGVMPRFMVPRYVEFVRELPKTDATLRVKKAELRRRPLNTEETWDRQVARD